MATSRIAREATAAAAAGAPARPPAAARPRPAPAVAPRTGTNNPAPTDAELLQRCREGHEAAWAELVRRYQGLVWSQARRAGLPHEDCADCFQHVWTQFYRSLGRIRHPEALPRWFIVAASRRAYHLAALRRRSAGPLNRDFVDPARIPDERVVAAESRHRVEAALEQLGGRLAPLIRMLFLEQPRPSYEEISARTGFAVGSIGPMRARALARLRRILEVDA